MFADNPKYCFLVLTQIFQKSLRPYTKWLTKKTTFLQRLLLKTQANYIYYSVVYYFYLYKNTSPYPGKSSLVKLMLMKDLPCLTYNFKYFYIELREWGTYYLV